MPTRNSAWLKLAAGISVAVAIVGLALYDLPNFFDGASDSDDPFVIVLGSFTTDILAFVAAFGAWQRRRWGAVLLIVINVFWTLQAIGGLFTAEEAAEVAFSGVMLALHVAVITFCLRQDPAVAVAR